MGKRVPFHLVHLVFLIKHDEKPRNNLIVTVYFTENVVFHKFTYLFLENVQTPC